MSQNKQKEMSFLGHLEELRWMLVRSTIVVLLLGTVAFFFSDFLFDKILFGPKNPNFVTYQFFCEMATMMGQPDSEICNLKLDFIIQNTSMSGQINLLIWTCILAGFIMGIPFILYEVWKFIKPALYPNEQKNALAFISISSLLFFIGVLFGYFVILPLSVYFFGSFQTSAEISNEFNLDSYIGMIRTTVIACGIVFELPIIIYFLSKLGLVDAQFLRTYRRYALVIILILAAIITPPDILSQIIVAIPILILYEISIFISKAVEKNRKIS